MIEKLYRVLVDAGDMTSLQRAHRKLYNTWSALGKKCPNKYRKPGQDSKSVNVILSNNDGASGYGNLFNVLSFCQSTDRWVDTGANIHVCVDVSLFSCSI